MKRHCFIKWISKSNFFHSLTKNSRSPLFELQINFLSWKDNNPITVQGGKYGLNEM